MDLRCRTFLKFNLSAIPSNAVIINATLEMDAFDYQSTIPPTDVATHFVFPVAWNESTLTWNLPPNSLDEYNANPTDTQTINAPGIYQWNVKSNVMAAFYSNLPYHALLKVADDVWVSGQSDLVRFRSKESGSPPNLIVEYAYSIDPGDPPELEGSVKLVKITGPLEPYKDKSNLIYLDGSDDGPHRVSHYNLSGGPTNFHLDDKLEVTYTGSLLNTGEPNHIKFSPGSGDQPSTSATFEYDSLGRLIHASSNPPGSGTDTFTDLDLNYDILGKLNYARVTYDNDSYASWTLGYDPNDNIFKRVYEKKNNSLVPPYYSGMVDYFLINPVKQLLYNTTPGASGIPTIYNYDPADRLTSPKTSVD